MKFCFKMKEKKNSSYLKETQVQDESFAIDVTELRKRLEDDDFFLVSLIDTIPPKMYFDEEVNEKIVANKHAVMDEVAKGLKRNSNVSQEITSKNKHKRARLDPQLNKSVSQIQEEIGKSQKKEMKHKKSLLFTSASLERAANIEELKKRLEEKIKNLQEKRRGCTENEFLQKKRLKRKKNQLQKSNKGNLNKSSNSNNEIKVEKFEKNVKKIKPKPVYNKEGKIIYSKFDFSDSGVKEKKNTLGGKNYKKLLQRAEKEKEKIEKVKEEDTEKATSLIQKKVWQRAIQKAEGVKLKDDPVLLKKSLKKDEKRKKKSAKAWKGRIEHVEKMKKMKQEKRAKNIQAKKKEKFNKKIKHAKKKGRIIPGF